jgi:YVTN family beta-propeller protein
MAPRSLARSLAASLLVTALAGPAAATFVTFETGQVRPLALSPDGNRLFAVNTPDDRLEIFTIGVGGSLTPAGSVPVGLEPAAVAARSNSEVWVVNHLSDSVSIVDVGSSPPRVTRTLLVGDEPRDIVFGGPVVGGLFTRAFITTAHRGQNSGVPLTDQTAAGKERADVWVFDPTSLGATLGGTPLTKILLFGDTPRALAASADGTVVYAAVFHSGNQTTTINEGSVCNGGAGAGPCNVFGSVMPGGLPAPNVDHNGVAGPETGLIVKFDQASGQWRDRLGRDWSNGVRFSLPDFDVFKIDATLGTPAATESFAHVGTVLFNMAVSPTSNTRVYVSNTDARNEVRFEGPGGGGSTVRGHLHEARITVLQGVDPPTFPTQSVTPRHLNKHIDYSVVPSPVGVSDKSFAIPNAIALSSNGATLYVAAFGSSQVGVFPTGSLEDGSFVPTASNHINVTGGGPSGLVLDEGRGRLYVMTRFDNGISVVDTATQMQVAHVAVHNPEPAIVTNGRHILYDAVFTSSNGETSCASCHIFGDFDSLAWDLGNPDDVVLTNPNPIEFNIGQNPDFHPLKGPMTTQSLRGMANSGPMHWRGDRTGGNDPGGDALSEDQAFKKFNVAFAGLLGRSGPLTAAEMQAFTDFILQVTYPPNPNRDLDNVLKGPQLAGHDLYFGRNTDTVRQCNGCHVLDPVQGSFGTRGFTSFENETQMFKVPHLRNLYQKVGMFGMPQVMFLRSGNNGTQGIQVRGFGFLHDGSVDTIFRFHGATVFDLNVSERQNMEQFMLAFDSNLAPIVGQQITLTNGNAATVGPRIDLMIARAVANECEVVAKANVGGFQRGWRRLASGMFRSDKLSEAQLTDAQLRTVAATATQELTYTCVPPGSGVRIGVDRDEDGFFDTDEVIAGTDPADPSSFPGATTTTTTSTTTTTTVATTTATTTTVTTTTGTTTTLAAVLIQTTSLSLADDNAPPINLASRKVSFKSSTRGAPAGQHVVLPAPGSSGDPRAGGAFLTVYNSAGLTTDDVALFLPASGPITGQGWSLLGTTASPKGYRYKGKDLNGPISSITVKADSISVSGGKSNWTYTLNEPQQGKVAVRLQLGNALPWCAEAPAKASGSPPSTAKNDKVDKFTGAKSPAPASCPPTP